MNDIATKARELQGENVHARGTFFSIHGKLIEVKSKLVIQSDRARHVLSENIVESLEKDS